MAKLKELGLDWTNVSMNSNRINKEYAFHMDTSLDPGSGFNLIS